MAETLFTPAAGTPIEIGGMIDDTGQRYMVMRFTDAAGSSVIVPLLIPLFQDFARLCGAAAEASATRDFWRTVPRP